MIDAPTIRPMLLGEYGGEDPAGMLASRKWDGIRATFRDGRLWSRNGNQIAAPEWFTSSLPALPLDGELVLGDALPAMLRCHQLGLRGDWESVVFHVFDLVMPGPVEERILKLSESDSLPTHCRLVEHTKILDRDHFNTYGQALQDDGCEGVVLRKPGSDYVHGRSGNCLKLRF